MENKVLYDNKADSYGLENQKKKLRNGGTKPYEEKSCSPHFMEVRNSFSVVTWRGKSYHGGNPG